MKTPNSQGHRIQWAILYLLIGMSCQVTTETPDPPNVVLILVDDYGYGDISLEGNTQIRTPNIDRIGQEGLRLTNFYQSSAACAPTRASLLTGRDHLRAGVWGVHWGRDYLSLDETTFAEVLKTRGYATGAFGKWHSGKSTGYHTWNRGFDVGVETSLYNYFNSKTFFNNKLVNVSGPMTDVVGDQAVKFIRDNKDQPFLCYVPFQAIHEPFNSPPEIFEKYKAQGYRDHVARLYGMVEVLDKNVGKILNTLDELSLAENTIVFFMVDDGPSPGFDLTYRTRRMNPEERAQRERAWGRLLRGGKASIWEGGSISPCYVRWPGHFAAGKEIHQLSGVIDVLPTLADLGGASIPENLDGRSLLPLLSGDTSGWGGRKYYDNTNFYQIPMNRIDMSRPEVREMSVRYKNYKYVRVNHKLYTGQDSTSNHLFDLSTDPKEETNILENSPQLAAELGQSLGIWYEDILSSGRAFTPPLYQVGDWNEPAAFINLDGFASVTGGLERQGFRVVGWENIGDALTYDIEALEEGDYQVQMFYGAEKESLGAVFEVSTEHGSAEITINQDSTAMSGEIKLPKGRQTLTIRLKQLGYAAPALSRLNSLLVHRIPNEDQPGILSNVGFELGMESSPEDVAYVRSDAVVLFRLQGGMPGEIHTVKAGEALQIKPFVGNPDALKQIEIFLDFESVLVQPGTSEFALTAPREGRHSLNVEFESLNGIKGVVRVDLVVE